MVVLLAKEESEPLDNNGTTLPIDMLGETIRMLALGPWLFRGL